MLITRKILINFTISSILLNNLPTFAICSFQSKPRHTFCTNQPGKQQLSQIYYKLIQQSHKLKPEAVVKMMHYLQFSNPPNSSTGDQPKRISDHQLDKILNDINSFMHKLTHKDVVLLLQTISQFEKYEQYDRNNEIMRSIVKKLNSLQTMSIDYKYIYRLLNCLEKMSFPSLTIQKYVNNIVNINANLNAKRMKATQGKQANPDSISKLDALRFFISVAQLKFIPVSMVAKFYDTHVKNIGIGNPKQLAHLYYISRTLEKSLGRKLKYFGNRIHLHELVFNPYSQIINIEDSSNNSIQQNPKEGSNNQGKHQKQDVKYEQEQMRQMHRQCQELIAKVRANVDMDKVRQNICRLYQFEKYPFDKTTALFLSDMPELKTNLIQYINKNYLYMEPSEFIRFIQIMPENARSSLYNQYTRSSWEFLSLYDRLLMTRTKIQVCDMQISKQEIAQLIRERQSINGTEFQLLSYIISKYLKPSEQLQLLRIVDSIADKQVKP